MKPLVKGLVIALIQLCLVSSLGAKLLYDRTTSPRVWVQTAPYDPNLPIRGRYVSLQLLVEPRGMQEYRPKQERELPQAVALRVEDGRLLAEKRGDIRYDSSGLNARYTNIDGKQRVVLSEPVAFFIPEGIPDPSRRQPGEELWVEATIPKKGMPRPIQLGIKKGSDQIRLLDIR